MSRVIIVCQARLGSTRLPRKVLLPVAGAPLILRFLERVQRSRLATDIVVATTTDEEDNVLSEICAAAGYRVFRGHSTDLLDRHVKTARAFQAEVVVKIPSDCPLIDPGIIDEVIAYFLKNREQVDYVSNLHPPSWPDGNDVEVMSAAILEQAWAQAEKQFEREHTTPWIWNANNTVRIGNVVLPGDKNYSATHRWTIDYPEDYVLIKAVYDHLYDINPEFSTADILQFISDHPEVGGVNSHLNGVSWYRDHLDELPAIDPTTVRAPGVLSTTFPHSA